MRLLTCFRASALLSALTLTACGRGDPALQAPGVPLALAESRAANLSDVHYAIHLRIPSTPDSAVTGRIEMKFQVRQGGEDLIVDFRAPAENVVAVVVDGDTITPRLVPDHIVIPARRIKAGPHVLSIEFTSTDAALNRSADWMYALFVPDRASTAIPVFEQPDLKAWVTLSLEIPPTWDAVANGPLTTRDSTSIPGRHLLRFGETQPISTYLMSFAVGKLQRLTAERGGRTFTMYHRETDSLRLARNAPAIFDLHAAALAWLENYTDIRYPFGKFDFFLVPAFQFGGMEHPGAVWYRADALFLPEAPSRTQELARASLIAHETAHMWFGDLVTMRWFNDVWMKEVFANFMAAKIVRPSFPDVDHALRFFQAHHAAAYGVDRTAGANPIRQELANLREAGTLYGAIIYQKAPVVMQQLETLVGDSLFRDALRVYLAEHAFGNATWPDLVRVMDSLSTEDVASWSRVWVEEPGRPSVEARVEAARLIYTQRDTWTALTAAFRSDSAPTRALRWPQRVATLVAWGNQERVVEGSLSGDSLLLDLSGVPQAEPDVVLPGVDGQSYGRFPLSERTRSTLLTRASRLRVPLHRAVAWQGLYEEMIDARLAPNALLNAALDALPAESDELVASQLLGLIRTTFWRFHSDSARRAVAPLVERTLWTTLERAQSPGRKGTLFSAIIGVTLSPEGVTRLERIWRKQETPRGFPISEAQYIAIAEGLALRDHPRAQEILDEQERRITDPDRLARQRFMRAALSANVAVRDSLFETFKQVENRRRESWVLDAQSAMQHPLRAASAIGQVEPSLALTEEIQSTGDIFFPLRWLNATLDGHQSPEAAAIVRRFLETHPQLNPRVRAKILQAADDLFRAAR